MSYLIGPRIAFGGTFLADVPTGNNRGADFDPASPPDPDSWNPFGGGTFDFLHCTVTGGESAPGVPIGPLDPARRLEIRGAADRPSAKLVDLDPDWQFSSQVWGLMLRVVDPATDAELLSGQFHVSAFRDMGRRQVDGVAVNRMPASASFPSVLEDVRFGAGSAAHPVLAALRAGAERTGRLSVVLNLFGFSYAHTHGLFGTGSLTGCLGLWQDGEPLTFVTGRRLDAGVLPGTNHADPSRPVLLGRSVAAVDVPAGRLVLDLGNAYPISDHRGTPTPLAAPAVALEAALLSEDPATPGATVLGDIPLDEAPGEAGVFTFPLSPATLAAAQTRSIAVLLREIDGRRRLVCRETTDGLYVRADEFVHRLDAGGSARTTVYAVRRGVPVAGLAVHFVRSAGERSVLTVPDRLSTGPDGTVTVELTARDPGNPRGPVDGTVEQVGYPTRLTGDGRPDYAGTGLDPFLDRIVLHVRDAFTVPDRPEWERHVQPVLAQYARLYPIMGTHLADLGDLEAIRPYRAAMLLAMTRDVGDPNYMPVTRDLSGPKHATIVRFLEQLAAAPGGLARHPAGPLGQAVPGPEAGEPSEGLPEHDAKTAMAGEAARRATPDTSGAAVDVAADGG